MIGTKLIFEDINKYKRPPVVAKNEPILIHVLIDVKLRKIPVRIKAVRSLHAEYTEFTYILPGKYFK